LFVLLVGDLLHLLHPRLLLACSLPTTGGLPGGLGREPKF